MCARGRKSSEGPTGRRRVQKMTSSVRDRQSSPDIAWRISRRPTEPRRARSAQTAVFSLPAAALAMGPLSVGAASAALLFLASTANAAPAVPIAIATSTSPFPQASSNFAGVNVGHSWDAAWLPYMKRLGVNGEKGLDD